MREPCFHLYAPAKKLKTFDYRRVQIQRNALSMRERLLEILANSSSPGPMAWLGDTLASQSQNFERNPFYYAFSGVSRHFDKKGAVVVSEDQARDLEQTVAGFSVRDWDQFRLARVILLLVLAEQEKSTYLETLAALRNTADLRETAAIFSAYPLLPHQEELTESAVDGLRTNIVDVFDAIALNNPFPFRNFSDEEWNQMVLKAIFINRPLYRIVAIGKKSNAALAAAISDLAHERWSAGRQITPEAWRSVIPFVDDRITSDLVRLSQSESENDRLAAELVGSSNNDDIAWEKLGKTLES